MRNVPSHGRALLVANHAGSLLPVRRDDDDDGADEGAPAAALAAVHGPRLGVRAAVSVELHAPRSAACPAGPTTRSRLLERGRARDGVPRGREGTGEAVLGSLPAASASGAAASSRSRCRPGAPIIPVAVVGSEEIYPKLGDSRDARPGGRRAVRADHPDLPLARAARAGPAAVALADRVLRADRRLGASARGRRGPPARLRHLRAGARDDPGARSTRTSSSAGRFPLMALVRIDSRPVTVRVRDERGDTIRAAPAARRLASRSFAPRSTRRSPTPTPTNGSDRCSRRRSCGSRFGFTDVGLTSTSPPASDGPEPELVVAASAGWPPKLELTDGLARSPTASCKDARASRSRSPAARFDVRGESRSALLCLPATRLLCEPYREVVKTEYPALAAD